MAASGVASYVITNVSDDFTFWQRDPKPRQSCARNSRVLDRQISQVGDSRSAENTPKPDSSEHPSEDDNQAERHHDGGNVRKGDWYLK
jgi:hypothetical protein